MKRTILAAVAALLAAAGAHAQMMPTYSSANVYGELGYTWLKIDAEGTSSRPDAIRGILGYDFHPNAAVEAMFAGGVSDDSKSGTVNGVPTNVDVDLKHMYGIFLRPKYQYQAAEVFARLGWAHTKVSVRSTNNNLVDSTQSNDDFAWGLGVNFRFNPRMYVGLDWMRYSNQSGEKVDGITLGFGYHW
jgi:opacity protein-like surface antigen